MATFLNTLNRCMSWEQAEENARYLQEIVNMSAHFIMRERAVLAADPGIWRAIRVSLGWTVRPDPPETPKTGQHTPSR